MPAPLPAESLVGKVLGGRYRIVQVLGSGGMGDVYLAERLAERFGVPPDARRVAVKVMRAESRWGGERPRTRASDGACQRPRPSLERRFEREASAAARLRHPNVREVHEVERLGCGTVCFAMELLVGLDLADTLAYQRALAPARAVRIAAEAARGLAAAHAAGVIHRDVKPENIFLVHAPDGRELVKLLDFGFAWMPGDEDDEATGQPQSGDRTVVGTPEYIAPEQAHGAVAAPGADIYSLGIVLHEMLVGRVPFTGPYPRIAQLHASSPVVPFDQMRPRPAVSRELEAVVMRALEKSPTARFPTATTFREALLGVPEAGSGA